MFVNPEAGARFSRHREGEVFHLDAPHRSGLTGVDLSALPMPDGTDPIALLQRVSDSSKADYEKTPLQYALVIPPRMIRNEQGMDGAEMQERWDRGGAGKWQRVVHRVFVRNGRAYLLSCFWRDELGDNPLELHRILEGLRFDL